VAHPHRTYQPRDTEHAVLHAVIREHLEPFLREVSDRGDGHGLPRFVKQEFREFLTCGVLAHSFTRLRRADCTFERLVPFSCKRGGFCPSVGGSAWGSVPPLSSTRCSHGCRCASGC
jgi:hypothetical protein